MEVRSDNVAALTLITSMKASGRSINLIARELALTLGAGCWKPKLASHIPGISNILADWLSRRSAPGSSTTEKMPPQLVEARRVPAPLRDQNWWKTWAPISNQDGSKEGRPSKSNKVFKTSIHDLN